MLEEKAVRKEEEDMMRQERRRVFLRPREESARVARAKPPTMQPRKNEDEGRPEKKEGAQYKPHSDTMEECEPAGESHAHESLGDRQISQLEFELEASTDPVVQCHLGLASVKTAMKVCWASKNHARQTTRAWRSWAANPKSRTQRSNMESREGPWSSSVELEAMAGDNRSEEVSRSAIDGVVEMEIELERISPQLHHSSFGPSPWSQPSCYLPNSQQLLCVCQTFTLQ